MLYYESDVRDTVMILYEICQLVCVIDPWAHTSFVHSILSLKLGVTIMPSKVNLSVGGSASPFIDEGAGFTRVRA